MKVETEHQLFRWLEENLGIKNATVTKALGGGNSNVTVLLDSDRGPLVLRHPPENTISSLAGQGIEREFHVLQALGAKGKIPRAVGACEDASVIGYPFVITTFVDGVAITDTLPDSYQGRSDSITRIGEELVDGIGEIHNVDWRALQSLTLRKSSAFLQRQIERWTKIRSEHSVRQLPLFEELATKLHKGIPAESPSTIVHGDYHLDNALFSTEQPKLEAILDWELVTLGDPRIDLGLLLAFWGERSIERPAFPFVQQVTRTARAPSKQYLAERWEKCTGIRADNYRYFCAFSFWRLAAIVEGAYALYQQGKTSSDYAKNLEFDVPALLEESRIYLDDL